MFFMEFCGGALLVNAKMEHVTGSDGLLCIIKRFLPLNCQIYQTNTSTSRPSVLERKGSFSASVGKKLTRHGTFDLESLAAKSNKPF